MAKNDTGTTTIQLSKPININGAELKTLQMREPTVGDQLAADNLGGTDAEKELSMVAMLCMVTPTDLHQLTMRDYKKVQAAYVGFFG